jgi:hypothetical protein
VRPARSPRTSLLVTLALATVAAACKRTPAAPDAAAAGDATIDTRRPVVQPPDAAAPDAAEPDAAPDAALPRDLSAPDAAAPDAPRDAATSNPSRLWFHGPESDLQLADMEPETPF